MNSKKLMLVLITILSSVFCLFAQRIDKDKQVTEIERQKLITNLNYVQYSTVQITKSMNKEVADSEYNFILNRIDNEGLIDYQIVNAYKDLLDTLAKISLKEEEKDFINQMAEAQRKTAFANSFSSFGSVFVPGASPQQMVASLVYTGTAAAFNYINTVNSIKQTNQKELFQITQQEKEYILLNKDEFFKKTKVLGQRYGLDDKLIIDPQSMSDVIDTFQYPPASKADSLDVPKFKEIYENFPPFWFELGSAYQESGNNKKAILYYSKFESLMKNKVLKNDFYYIQEAKNMIQIYLGGDSNYKVMIREAYENRNQILNYLKIIEKETPAEVKEVAKNNLYAAKIYYLLGNYTKSLELLDWNMKNKIGAPEYIEESISLFHIIMSEMKNQYSNYYKIADSYAQISFGPSTSSTRKVLEQIEKEKKSAKTGYVSYYNSIDNSKLIKKSNLYWAIPEHLLKKYKISISLNGLLYIPEILYPLDKYKKEYSPVCFIDYEIDALKKPVILSLNFVDLESNEEFTLEYFLQPISKKEIQIVQKALSRIGSDISTKNANVIIGYAAALKDYKYTVDDINDERKTVEKMINKEYKKDGLAKEQLDDLISTELSKKLKPDLKKLKSTLAQVERDNYSDYQYKSEVYKKSYSEEQPVPYSSSIYQIENKIFASSLVSIIPAELPIKITFDTVGKIVIKNSDEVKAASLNEDLDNIYRTAKLGNTNSQFEYGRRLYEGVGLSINYQESVKWLYRAASKNHPEACKYMGLCYIEGNGVHKDSDIAKEWFLKAHSLGVKVDEKYIK